LLQHETHRGVQGTVRALNHLVQAEPALYARDFEPEGFAWVVGDDRNQSVFAYLRFGADGAAPVLVVCNFTPVPRHEYRIGVPGGAWAEVFNSDAVGFGGSGVGTGGVIQAAWDHAHGYEHSVTLSLPPLAVIVLKKV
jgi:1,4-alpha-glucan branching enzyme